jgi:hypothetical protein
MEENGQLHVPAVLSPGKELVRLNRRQYEVAKRNLENHLATVWEVVSVVNGGSLLNENNSRLNH